LNPKDIFKRSIQQLARGTLNHDSKMGENRQTRSILLILGDGYTAVTQRV